MARRPTRAGLYHDVRGNGPDVVLLHGLGADGTVWKPVVDRLAARARCVVPDLRGHGRSTEPPRTFADWCADVAAIRKATGALEDAIVVGHGLGARVATHVAADGAAALLLLAPPLLSARDPLHPLAAAEPTSDAVARCVQDWFSEGWRRAHRAEVDAHARRIAANPHLARALAAAQSAPPLRTALEEVRCPVHVCLGTDDPNQPTDGVRIGAQVRTVRILPRVGHHVPLEAPDVVVEEVLRAIEGDEE